MSNIARDTAKEARDALKASGKAVSEASGDIQTDLENLREDVTQLTQQLADIAASRGAAALRKAKSNANDLLSEVEEKGRDAIEAMEEAFKTRPYTSLLIAVGVGFVFGATWRR
jgi:ElaB/YqjD/DUF883 family membrane-anchored ribosome-binding protein